LLKFLIDNFAHGSLKDVSDVFSIYEYIADEPEPVLFDVRILAS